MNKNSFKFAVITALVLLPLLSFSCNVTVSDSQYLTRPDIEATKSGIAVRLPIRSSKTESINIYRREVLSDKKFSTASCIGILFPKNIDSSDQTYLYEDVYLIKNKSYQYRARLCNSNGDFYWTNWTSSFTAKSGLAADSVLTYDSPDGKIVYYEATNQFAFDGTISNPSGIANFEEEGFKPAIVIKDTETNDTSMVILRNFTAKYYAKELLQQSLYDKDIFIDGILAYKEEINDDDEPKIKRLILTEIKHLPLFTEKEDSTQEEIEDNIIKIETTPVNTGYDISTEKTNSL